MQSPIIKCIKTKWEFNLAHFLLCNFLRSCVLLLLLRLYTRTPISLVCRLRARAKTLIQQSVWYLWCAKEAKKKHKKKKIRETLGRMNKENTRKPKERERETRNVLKDSSRNKKWKINCLWDRGDEDGKEVKEDEE